MKSRLAVVFLLLFTATPAFATYSPPLTRVRIDRDRATHTVSLLYAQDDRRTNLAEADLRALGGQYLGQLEWADGYGFQLGVALAKANVEGSLRNTNIDADGIFIGGQLRLYHMLWSGGAPEGSRPHAVTAFINARVAYYNASSDLGAMVDGIDVSLFNVTGGIGLMAELSIVPWLSFCPYAWLTPGFSSQLDYRLGVFNAEDHGGPTLRQPLLFGADLWFYPLPDRWEGHLSLSIIASLIDTTGRGNRLVSGVVGWTF